MYLKVFKSVYLHENADLGTLCNSTDNKFSNLSTNFQKVYLEKFGLQWPVAALCTLFLCCKLAQILLKWLSGIYEDCIILQLLQRL